MNVYLCLSGMLLIVVLRTLNGYFHADAYEALHLAYNLAHGVGYVARTSYDTAAFTTLGGAEMFPGMSVWPIGYPLLLAPLSAMGFSGLHAPTVICIVSFVLAWRTLHAAALKASHALPEALPALVLFNPPVFERFLYAGSEAPFIAVLLMFADHLHNGNAKSAMRSLWMAMSLRYSAVFCVALLPPRMMAMAAAPFVAYALGNFFLAGSFFGLFVANSDSIGGLILAYVGGILQISLWPLIVWLCIGQPMPLNGERNFVLTGMVQNLVSIVLRVFRSGPIPDIRFSAPGAALVHSSCLLRMPVNNDLRARALILASLVLNTYGLTTIFKIDSSVLGVMPSLQRALASVPAGTLVQDDLNLQSVLSYADGLQRAARPDLLWLRPHRSDSGDRIESEANFQSRLNSTKSRLRTSCVKLSGSARAPALTACDLGD